MRTVEQICNARKATALQKQLIVGFCHQAGIYNEQQLNLRKIHNRQIFNSCVKTLNKNNPSDEKDYINFVDSVQDLRDEHDFYVVSTTFGMKFYNLKTDMTGAPAHKLTTMLKQRMNTSDTCMVHVGTHKDNPFLIFTGLLLQHVANEYYKTNDYNTITENWNGYKVR